MCFAPDQDTIPYGLNLFHRAIFIPATAIFQRALCRIGSCNASVAQAWPAQYRKDLRVASVNMLDMECRVTLAGREIQLRPAWRSHWPPAYVKNYSCAIAVDCRFKAIKFGGR